jgi:hypothetical protein
MKLSALVFLIALGVTRAFASDAQFEASGSLYFIFDVGADAQMDGVLFARFVPDDKSRPKFHAVTSGKYPGAVKYVSFEPAENVLTAVVGAARAARLSHGRDRIAQIPVTLILRNYHSEVECDSRVYYATFVAAKRIGSVEVANGESVADGC